MQLNGEAQFNQSSQYRKKMCCCVLYAGYAHMLLDWSSLCVLGNAQDTCGLDGHTEAYTVGLLDRKTTPNSCLK